MSDNHISSQTASRVLVDNHVNGTSNALMKLYNDALAGVPDADTVTIVVTKGVPAEELTSVEAVIEEAEPEGVTEEVATEAPEDEDSSD